MNVLPEYLEGNRTGSYTPEQWLDEVKDKNSDEIIQEGTPMDAEHFNHMEQGIHNNSLMLALLLEKPLVLSAHIGGITLDIPQDIDQDFLIKIFKSFKECL